MRSRADHLVSHAPQGNARPEAYGWLAAVLSDGKHFVGYDELPIETLLATAELEEVTPLLEKRLREREGWETIPLALRDSLGVATRKAAMAALFREREIRRISRALEAAGIQALLLKGNALGFWLYPNPALRISNDIDLLVPSRVEAIRAMAAFAELGYTMEPAPGDQIHEMKGQLIVDGVPLCEIDLHDRLLNAPIYAETFSFDELWGEAMVLPSLGDAVRLLSPQHAFAHACMNRALDAQLGIRDRLKLLHDFHLFCARSNAAGWEPLVALLRVKQISGTGLYSLCNAIRILGTHVPEAVLDALAEQAGTEALDWRRFRDWPYMQWRNLEALPTPMARIRWLWQRLAPAPSRSPMLNKADNRLIHHGRRIARLVRRLRRP